VGICLCMEARMLGYFSDVFMTFISFSDVLRTSPELIVEKYWCLCNKINILLF